MERAHYLSLAARQVPYGIAVVAVLLALRANAAAPTSAPAAITAPKLLQQSAADYPPTARAQGVGATVVLELDLGADGAVADARIIDLKLRGSSADDAFVDAYGFGPAALAAARELRFKPAEANGKPLAVRVRYTYRFEPPPPTAAKTPDVASASQPAAFKAQVPRARKLFGRVRQRGSRNPLAGCTVRVFAEAGEDIRETTTNGEGWFTFPDLAPGRWRVEVTAEGYYPFRSRERLAEGDEVELTAYLEPGRLNPYDVTVSATRPRKEVVRRRLDRVDITGVPGTLGDPVLVVENLPGVARPAPGSGDIIVRGSGPQDTGVFIDGVSVPTVYHFGGLRSVVPAELVSSIDFFPGNFSARYGRVLGGVFNANLRDLKPKRFGGSLDVSLLDAGVYLQTPLGDTAALAVAGRRSYIDAVLQAAVPEDTVNLATAPVYYDYQAMAQWRPGEAHLVKAVFLGAFDELRFLFGNPAALNVQLQSGNLSLLSRFHRGSLSYSYTPTARFRNDLVLALGEDATRFGLGGLFSFSSNVLAAQLRDDAVWQIGKRLTLTAGVDAKVELQDVEVLAPRPPREGDGVGNNSDFDDRIYTKVENALRVAVAPFVEAEINITDRLTAVPSLRLDTFSALETVSVDPRLLLSYQLTTSWEARAGVALTHQPPSAQERDDSFGNPDLGLQRALSVSAGPAWRPLKYLNIEATFFFKEIFSLVSSTGAVVERDGALVPAVYDNEGRGRIFGLELFAEHRFHKSFRAWLSYTLMSARRTDSGATESRLFDFDQRHILNVVASYTLPHNWRIGVRWRFVSGNPYTPVIGSTFVSDFDEYQAISGSVNTKRLPAFHQLDLRLDKQWLFEQWRLTAYLSLSNAYNQKNVEGISYNYDFSQSGVVAGLPLLPIVGVKGEF